MIDQIASNMRLNPYFYWKLKQEFDDLLEILISEDGPDPWLENNNNETPFDLMDKTVNYISYNKLHNLWTKRIVKYKLMDPNTTTIITTTMDPNHYNIFDKIQNDFDDSSTKNFMNKIFSYIWMEWIYYISFIINLSS